MNPINTRCVFGLALVLLLLGVWSGSAWPAMPTEVQTAFPPALNSYQDAELDGISARLLHRIKQAPFNLVATLIFLCAVIHTFMASRFTVMSQDRHQAHRERIRLGEAREGSGDLLAGVY
ncbi:hypothetical protein, partial [Thiohalocapsa sp.]|uniref:hypothetical protein n=1 Tax=Thiohalocapsa sp. TaxID=2497641 RepID=UPI0025DC148D